MIDEITVEVVDGVQIIRINRPEKKNALTVDMYGAMNDALRNGEASDDIAVHLITGTDGIFSAGADLREFLMFATGGEKKLEAYEFLKTIAQIEKPLVAAVDGLAVGIGTTMLLHCDLVYASPNATFSTPFVNLGMVPEGGSSLLVPRMMGSKRAFEMLCLGQVFDAEKAHGAGLINEIVAADELLEYAVQCGRLLATKPPEALKMSRQMIRGEVQEVLDCMAAEIEVFTERLVSAEAREAFTAFFEKRPPDFSRKS